MLLCSFLLLISADRLNYSKSIELHYEIEGTRGKKSRNLGRNVRVILLSIDLDKTNQRIRNACLAIGQNVAVKAYSV